MLLRGSMIDPLEGRLAGARRPSSFVRDSDRLPAIRRNAAPYRALLDQTRFVDPWDRPAGAYIAGGPILLSPQSTSAGSTWSVAFIRIARARLSKLGETFCTSAWMSANCSGVPSPAIRTT